MRGVTWELLLLAIFWSATCIPARKIHFLAVERDRGPLRNCAINIPSPVAASVTLWCCCLVDMRVWNGIADQTWHSRRYYNAAALTLFYNHPHPSMESCKKFGGCLSDVCFVRCLKMGKWSTFYYKPKVITQVYWSAVNILLATGFLLTLCTPINCSTQHP